MIVDQTTQKPIARTTKQEIVIRPGHTADHRAAEALQLAAFQHLHWPFRDDSFLVAEIDGELGAYLVWRQTAFPGEYEILSLATHPTHQRKGLARMLVNHFCHGRKGDIFLEVRESNHGARAFYEAFGFFKTGTRHAYYADRNEGAVVMKLVNE